MQLDSCRERCPRRPRPACLSCEPHASACYRCHARAWGSSAPLNPGGLAATSRNCRGRGCRRHRRAAVADQHLRSSDSHRCRGRSPLNSAIGFDYSARFARSGARVGSHLSETARSLGFNGPPGPRAGDGRRLRTQGPWVGSGFQDRRTGQPGPVRPTRPGSMEKRSWTGLKSGSLLPVCTRRLLQHR